MFSVIDRDNYIWEKSICQQTHFPINKDDEYIEMCLLSVWSTDFSIDIDRRRSEGITTGNVYFHVIQNQSLIIMFYL